MRWTQWSIQGYFFGALCVAAIAVFASILDAGAANASRIIRYVLVEGHRDEEMRPELVPAVAAIRDRTRGAVLAYLHDPADPTDRSVRELAFPSVVIFASEAELRAGCMKELRAKYPIRYLISVKPLDAPCLFGSTLVAKSTPKTPQLWLTEIR